MLDAANVQHDINDFITNGVPDAEPTNFIFKAEEFNEVRKLIVKEEAKEHIRDAKQKKFVEDKIKELEKVIETFTPIRKAIVKNKAHTAINEVNPKDKKGEVDGIIEDVAKEVS